MYLKLGGKAIILVNSEKHISKNTLGFIVLAGFLTFKRRWKKRNTFVAIFEFVSILLVLEHKTLSTPSTNYMRRCVDVWCNSKLLIFASEAASL